MRSISHDTKRFGFVGVAEAEQRVHRERRVTDPRVAVVPVALAADLFRQAAHVGAATSAPVGAYVISLRVIAERVTISRQRPVYVDRSSHSRQ